MSSFSAGAKPLLRGSVKRELAMLDAAGQPAGHLGHGVLAVSRDEIGERRKQRGIGQHLRLDAVMQRLFPCIEDVSQSLLAPSLVLSGLSCTLCRLQWGITCSSRPLVLKPKAGTDARPTGEKGELTVNQGDSTHVSGTSPSLLLAAEKRNALLGFRGLRLGGLTLFPLWLLRAVDLTGLGSSGLTLVGLGLGRRPGSIDRGLGGVSGFCLWG